MHQRRKLVWPRVADVPEIVPAIKDHMKFPPVLHGKDGGLNPLQKIAYFGVPKEDGGRNWNIYGSIGAALTIAMLIGLVQGLLITRLKLQPFIVTLGTMLTLRGVSQTICEGSNISLANIPFANFADSGIFEHHGDARDDYERP